MLSQPILYQLKLVKIGPALNAMRIRIALCNMRDALCDFGDHANFNLNISACCGQRNTTMSRRTSVVGTPSSSSYTGIIYQSCNSRRCSWSQSKASLLSGSTSITFGELLELGNDIFKFTDQRILANVLCKGLADGSVVHLDHFHKQAFDCSFIWFVTQSGLVV